MPTTTLPSSVRLELDTMFSGLRRIEALGVAAKHAFRNFAPHRFSPGESNPSGAATAPLPYIHIERDLEHGLAHDTGTEDD